MKKKESIKNTALNQRQLRALPEHLGSSLLLRPDSPLGGMQRTCILSLFNGSFLFPFFLFSLIS